MMVAMHGHSIAQYPYEITRLRACVQRKAWISIHHATHEARVSLRACMQVERVTLPADAGCTMLENWCRYFYDIARLAGEALRDQHGIKPDSYTHLSVVLPPDVKTCATTSITGVLFGTVCECGVGLALRHDVLQHNAHALGMVSHGSDCA